MCSLSLRHFFLSLSIQSWLSSLSWRQLNVSLTSGTTLGTRSLLQNSSYQGSHCLIFGDYKTNRRTPKVLIYQCIFFSKKVQPDEICHIRLDDSTPVRGKMWGRLLMQSTSHQGPVWTPWTSFLWCLSRLYVRRVFFDLSPGIPHLTCGYVVNSPDNHMFSWRTCVICLYFVLKIK